MTGRIVRVGVVFLLLAAVATVALGVPQSSAEERPQGPLPGVTIKLVISTDAYDPYKPSQATIKCSAVNKSDDPIQVRVVYDSRVNVLRSKGQHLQWEMTLYHNKRSKEELKPISLKPGEGKVLFELSLDEVLRQRSIPQGKREWGWNWQGHPPPPPPPTPIHVRFGFVQKTTFYAKALVNDKWLSSEPIELKVLVAEPSDEPLVKSGVAPDIPKWSVVHNFGRIGQLNPAGAGVYFKLVGGKTAMKPESGYYFVDKGHPTFQAMYDLLYRAAKERWEVKARTESKLNDKGYAVVEQVIVDFPPDE